MFRDIKKNPKILKESIVKALLIISMLLAFFTNGWAWLLISVLLVFADSILNLSEEAIERQQVKENIKKEIRRDLKKEIAALKTAAEGGDKNGTA